MTIGTPVSLIRPKAGSRYRSLPVLGPLLDDWLIWLRGHGYSEFAVRNMTVRAARICRWLQVRRGQDLRGLTASDFRAAYDHFHDRYIEVAGTARVLGRFFHERHRLAAEPVDPPTDADRLLQSFRTYLTDVRGLSRATITGHCGRIRLFIQFAKPRWQGDAVTRMTLELMRAFLRRTATTNNRFSQQQIVGSLRTFLRHLFSEGLLRQPLHNQLDQPRVYRFERLPRAWPWEDVAALLRSIDRSTPIGLRDFTLLYLTATYGLRSGEVVRLTLDDINWREGTISVRQTKTAHSLLLPLTAESREVLARYLATRRPTDGRRELFFRRSAPIGPLAPTAVHDILDRRINLSGLPLPHYGTHALRHSLAIHLLRRGVGIPAIGATLGHRDVESTGIYLRLAIDDLREVGLPVPSGTIGLTPQPRGWHRRLLPVRGSPQIVVGRARFASVLAASLRRYVRMRRALGRGGNRERAVLRHWDDFLLRRYPTARRVTPTMFRRWADTLIGLAATVRRARMRIVHQFLLFHARRHPDTPIPDPLTFPKPSRPLSPRLVTAEEMARLVATAELLPPSARNPLRSPTIRLALILLFCCGLRRGELLRLRVRDFDDREAVLRIEQTKFHKSRLVPLPSTVAAEVRRYLESRPEPRSPDAPLLASDPRPGHETPYGAHALTENWQLVCLTAGVVTQRGHPPRLHDLRHSFAVSALDRWYRQGLEVQSRLPHLATYLGHANVVSTHYYLHLSSELGQSAGDRFRHYAAPILNPGKQS
jgi:integrase/recombinase XerD